MTVRVFSDWGMIVSACAPKGTTKEQVEFEVSRHKDADFIAVDIAIVRPGESTRM